MGRLTACSSTPSGESDIASTTESRERRSLLRRPLLISLIAVLLTGTLVWLYAAWVVLEESARTRLIAMRLAAESMRRDVLPGGESATPDNDSLARHFAGLSGYRVTIIAPDGAVLGDSESDFRLMPNHADRPEVIDALEGRDGFRSRISPTLQRSMVYLALPALEPSGRIIRVASLLEGSAIWSASTIATLLLLLLCATTITFFIVYFAYQPLVESLSQLDAGLRSLSRGDLTHRVPLSNVPGFEEVERAFNETANRLSTLYENVRKQRKELESLLGSTTEGVIAVGADDKIFHINDSALKMLGLRQIASESISLVEAVRNPELQRIVEMVRRARQSFESDISIDEGRLLARVYGSPIFDGSAEPSGVVIILHDVTRLRKLETIRQEFVANVSHELRTPITSVKGYLETLRDIGLESPDDARRFIEIASKQADRLAFIIDDLLALARLEREEAEGKVEFTVSSISEPLDAAVEACKPKADAREVRIVVGDGRELTAPMNSSLIEHALTNLIENAITYGPAGAEVRIAVRREEGMAVISVEDNGPGIAPEHQERLFERFYRVDRNRSRKMGGTGLGLAIVKHIAQIHSGKATVESTLGKGSRFSIHLPIGDS